MKHLEMVKNFVSWSINCHVNYVFVKVMDVQIFIKNGVFYRLSVVVSSKKSM